jgi:hypothetical protein
MSNQRAVLTKGIFVLSMDVELGWGIIDKPERMEIRKRYLEQSRDCIEKILMLLEKYNMSATWAVVGHLFLEECSLTDGQKHADIPRSTYPWYSEDWFTASPCTNEREAPLWYGRDIIKKIIDCPVHQEVASHSFAHMIFGNENTKRETARADLSNCVREAGKVGLKLRSFVFPRNDVGYIDELHNFGFEAYRGVEPSWYVNFPGNLKRVCHAIDQLFAICPPVSLPEFGHELYNIPASMFYLSMDKFRGLMPAKFRVIKAKRGIRKAIRDKKIFHLWFHPFNIATSQEKLLHGLEEIFKEVHSRREKGELDAKSMSEIVDSLKQV